MTVVLTENLRGALRDLERERIADEDNGLLTEAVALGDELRAIKAEVLDEIREGA